MALVRLDVRGLGDRLESVLPRPEAIEADVSEAVSGIIAQVRRDGDDALRSLTARFDKVEIDSIAVDPAELKAALGRIPDELRTALEVAHRRIRAYHEQDSAEPTELVSDGVRVTELVRPM